MSRLTYRSAHRSTLLAVLLIAALPASAEVALTASVLPSSRSVEVGNVATAFATVLNVGDMTGTDCSIAPATAFSGTFFFQQTNPATNEAIGARDAPVDIPANGGSSSFVFGFEPDTAFDTTEMQLTFQCTNSGAATVIPGVNTLSLAASDSPVADIVALGATQTQDAIANIPFRSATGFFTVATVNVGASGMIRASANTGGATVPVNLSLCETDPATSVCINPATPTAGEVTTQIDANETPTFAIFAQSDTDLDLDAAARRIFVNFADDGGVVRGATSVALRTRQYSQDLQPILDLNCTTGCHQPGGSAPFSLEANVSYGNLVNGGRVVPGDPDASRLVQRLEGIGGALMPLGGPPLPNDQIMLFRDWITADAPDDSGQSGGSSLAPPGDAPVLY